MGVENHKVLVVRINEIEKHANADTLGIVRVGGYQCVVKMDNYKVGDLAIYIQPDSVVPQTEPFRFIWENFQCEPDGTVPEKRRRITARRFRKEWSEGLLMPVTDFPEIGEKWGGFVEGDDVAEILNIKHYEPPEDPESTKGENEKGPGKQNKFWPRSVKGWFYFLVRILSFGFFDLNGRTGGSNEKSPGTTRPIYDVEAFKNFQHVIQEGEEVVITEKIHGSNARYTFSDGHMFAGSRKLWKSEKSPCIWRKVLKQHPWIEEWCRAHPDFTLYGEVVPTQKGYNYGCKDGEVKFFVFDILAPDGTWCSLWNDIQVEVDGPLVAHRVPLVFMKVQWDQTLKSLADGQSTVPGANHIREGIVIRPVVERQAHNLGRVQLKIVSNKFLEKDNA